VPRVELEEDEEGEEDAGDHGDIREDEEVRKRRAEGVVEAELSDIDDEEEAAENMEEVVGDELLGDGVMKSRGAGGGGVEPVEWVDEEL